jgi:hypothetical protein
MDNAVIVVFVVGGDRNGGDDKQKVDDEEPKGPAPRPARVEREAHAGQSGGDDRRKRWSSAVFLCGAAASRLSALPADVTLTLTRGVTGRLDAGGYPQFQCWILARPSHQ